MTPDKQRLVELMADRYMWFCHIGWTHPVLNDPKVIHGDATAEDIDRLMAEGMERWPLRAERPPQRAA